MESQAPTAQLQKNKVPYGIVFGLFGLLAISAFVPASWFGAKKQPVQQKLDLSALSEPGNLATDADNDGTISWKELVASSLAIPPEQANVQIETDPKAVADLNDPNNLTSSFTKNLYIASTALQQNGIIDETSKQAVVTQLLTEEVGKTAPKTYTTREVSTTSDTKEAIKKYGNDLGSIVNGLITEDKLSQTLMSVDAYMNAADERDLIPLQRYAQELRQAMKKMTEIKVPTSAVTYHILLLNSFEAYTSTVENLSVINTDAIRSTAVIRTFGDVAIAALRTTPTLSQYFKIKGVLFSSKESGYIYTVGYTK